MSSTFVQADARDLPLADASVDLIVTSPPYFATREYVDDTTGISIQGQIGTEPTPEIYLKALLACTQEMIRVLKPTGSIWVNLGDKYGRGSRTTISGTNSKQAAGHGNRCVPTGSPKSLLGLPWRYALRCVDDLGLILRGEVVWRKIDPVPDPAKDRVGRGHEQLFHFVKQQRYYSRPNPGQMSVWDMRTTRFRAPSRLGAHHHATFPVELPTRIIERWCPEGGVVLDPFGGSGTTALAAVRLGRAAITVDLSGAYCDLARWRVDQG